VLARLVGERNEDEVRRFLNGLLPEARLRSAPSPNGRERKKLALVAPNGKHPRAERIDILPTLVGDRADQAGPRLQFSDDGLLNSKR